MHLSKYPVYGERGEYRVDVYVVDCGCWGDDLHTDVYVPTGRRWRKWKRVVQECGGGRDYWDMWRGKYMELAKHTVAKYEHRLDTKERHERIHNRGIEQFEQWDGR